MPKAPIEMLIEAALFFKGGAVSVAELSKSLEVSTEEIEKHLETLTASLSGRGVQLVREGHVVALATAPEASLLIEKMRKDELEGPLGKAGLETLSVVIFRGPLSKADIDYIRGVNCSSILRSLLIRGLIDRVENPNDKRSYLYKATPELPAYLGVASVSEIPGYAETRERIEAIIAERAIEEPQTEELHA
jgi:segregation and condensation protein B